MTFQAKIVADSICTNKRITTVELQYPRFIHGEVMTHRVFSRNAMSSRAIPVSKMIDQVLENPATPVHWGANQPGMQANEELSDVMDETLGTSPKQYVKNLWAHAADQAAQVARRMVALGAHKQVANRILEPFQWMRTLVTATEWENFFELRCHPDAQPEFQHLAYMLRDAMAASTPVARIPHEVGPDSWHLPYVRDDERRLYRVDVLLKLSTARCARVSYLTHDGANPNVEQDIALYERLVGSSPIHASPCEHQAFPAKFANERSRNFIGWVQHRQYIDGKGAKAC